jgi:hypothetical protein
MQSQESMMELLQRVGIAIGISLILTLLLMVLYQDDQQLQFQPPDASITQAATVSAAAHGTP